MNIFKLHKIFRMDIEHFIEYYDSNEIVDNDSANQTESSPSSSESNSAEEEKENDIITLDYARLTTQNSMIHQLRLSNECFSSQCQPFHNLQGEKGGTQDANLVGLCSSCSSTFQDSIVHKQQRSQSISELDFYAQPLSFNKSRNDTIREETKSSIDVSPKKIIPLMISAPNKREKRISCPHKAPSTSGSKNKRRESIPKEIEMQLSKWHEAYEKSWKRGSI
eukprot:CAMPEP_0202969038 /NCGR_PEP_ID=MMETSP1396-20130829/14633_1 /ASSEMBLY_ACC=CAM_ASM_000872 /TAXON_ID= /ORGANISM="Pseudokeronopsis sp., Strain Brazil" /LENGTH=221 /DNA_ID=CAMNT_0049696115 /DNA_START=1320 /DNA_END=1985 /DNA_ORIENTATION=+